MQAAAGYIEVAEGICGQKAKIPCPISLTEGRLLPPQHQKSMIHIL